MRIDDIDSGDASRTDGDDLIFLDEALSAVGGADDVQSVHVPPLDPPGVQTGGELYARWRRMADDDKEK